MNGSISARERFRSLETSLIGSSEPIMHEKHCVNENARIVCNDVWVSNDKQSKVVSEWKNRRHCGVARRVVDLGEISHARLWMDNGLDGRESGVIEALFLVS